MARIKSECSEAQKQALDILLSLRQKVLEGRMSAQVRRELNKKVRSSDKFAKDFIVNY